MKDLSMKKYRVRQSTEKKQKAVTKRLSALEVLQSVLEDSNDGRVISKNDLTDDDQTLAPCLSPVLLRSRKRKPRIKYQKIK